MSPRPAGQKGNTGILFLLLDLEIYSLDFNVPLDSVLQQGMGLARRHAEDYKEPCIVRRMELQGWLVS